MKPMKPKMPMPMTPKGRTGPDTVSHGAMVHPAAKNNLGKFLHPRKPKL